MRAQHEAAVAAALGGATPGIGDQQVTDFARQVAEKSVDFAILVALPREFTALRLYFPELRHSPYRPTPSRLYYTGSISTALGGSYRIVATLLPSIGNLEASHATADLLRDWHPRFVLINGLAGGLSPGEQDLGDIVVSESIVYYEHGTLSSSGLERRTRRFVADRTLLDGIMNLESTDWRALLPPRPDGKDASSLIPGIHIGPLASGEKVIGSVDEVRRLRASQANLIAVEMESAGVASAAFSAVKQVGFLTIRAICDFADGAKDERWRDYAARSAASCLRAFLQERPVAPSEGTWPELPSARMSPRPLDTARRRKLFDHLCDALDMEEFKNFCFLVGADVDQLTGDRKSSRVRELILLFERWGQLHVLETALADNITRDRR